MKGDDICESGNELATSLKKLVVVIPTYNEEETVESVIKQIPRNLATCTKIVVIDKSSDATPIKAKKAGALVVKQFSGGLGTAFRIGIQVGIKLDADILVHIDGDLQYDPHEMPSLLKPILYGKVDMVLGRRIVQYEMPLIKRAGNTFFSWFVGKLCGVPVSDAQTGYRALNKKALETLLELRGDHTYTQESIFIATRRSIRICEVPVTFKKRIYGRSFISLSRYPIKVIVTLMRVYLRELSLPQLNRKISGEQTY